MDCALEACIRVDRRYSLSEEACRLPHDFVHLRTLGQASEAGDVPADAACCDMTDARYFRFHDVVYASQKARCAIIAAAARLTA